MDFFSKLAKTTDQSTPTTGEQQSSDPHHSTDLFNSIKVVAGAAQSHFRHEPATCDNSELAGATADLLGAASEYGKLDKTQGLGQYVDQAENYLKEYKTSNSVSTGPAATTESAAGEAGHGSTITDTNPADASKGAVASEDHVKADTTENVPKITSSGDGSSNIETVVKDEYKEGNKLSAGEVAAEPEVYGKPAGGSPGEGIDEGVSKKPPGPGEDSAIKTDGSAGEYEKSEVGYKLEGEATEDSSTKPSSGLVGPKVEASDEYDQSGQGCGKEAAAESFSDKPSGGYTAATTTTTTTTTTEGIPAKEAAGEDIGEKIISEASAGGFGNVSKLAGDFLRK